MPAKIDEIVTIDELAAEKGLPGQKIGKRWRFHTGAIDE